MVISDRTKGCCSSDLNRTTHPNHDQFAELDAHNCSAVEPPEMTLNPRWQDHRRGTTDELELNRREIRLPAVDGTPRRLPTC